MDLYWLNKSGNNKLILFFNGWGQDHIPFKNISVSKYDLLIVSDYNSIDKNLITSSIKDYSDIILIAWSMGVSVANYIFEDSKDIFSKCIAINGTMHPISDEFGIPEAIYNGTYDYFSEVNKQKFFKRMCGGKSTYDRFISNSPERLLGSQKQELKSLQNLVGKYSFKTNIFDIAIIGNDDKIFPTFNQQKFWETLNCNTKKIDAPHFAFFMWDSWENMIEYAE